MNGVIHEHVSKENIARCLTEDGFGAQCKQHHSVNVKKERLCGQHQENLKDTLACKSQSDGLHLKNSHRSRCVGHQ